MNKWTLTVADLIGMYNALKSEALGNVEMNEKTAKFLYACRMNEKRIFPFVEQADSFIAEFAKGERELREECGDDMEKLKAEGKKLVALHKDAFAARTEALKLSPEGLELFEVDFENVPKIPWAVGQHLLEFVRPPKTDEVDNAPKHVETEIPVLVPPVAD